MAGVDSRGVRGGGTRFWTHVSGVCFVFCQQVTEMPSDIFLFSTSYLFFRVPKLEPNTWTKVEPYPNDHLTNLNSIPTRMSFVWFSVLVCVMMFWIISIQTTMSFFWFFFAFLCGGVFGLFLFINHVIYVIIFCSLVWQRFGWFLSNNHVVLLILFCLLVWCCFRLLLVWVIMLHRQKIQKGVGGSSERDRAGVEDDWRRGGRGARPIPRC